MGRQAGKKLYADESDGEEILTEWMPDVGNANGIRLFWNRSGGSVVPVCYVYDQRMIRASQNEGKQYTREGGGFDDFGSK